MDRRNLLKKLAASAALLTVTRVALLGCRRNAEWPPWRGCHKNEYYGVAAKLMGIPEEYREKAAIIWEVSAFGDCALSLNSNGNFLTYEKNTVTYILIASKQLQIADHYNDSPISYYQSFTNKKQFDEERARFEAQGYDIRTRESGAMSTSQITDSFLQNNLEYIVMTVLHENMHQSINADPLLEEPICSVVGYHGLHLYADSRLEPDAAKELKKKGDDLEKYMKARRSAVNNAYARLRELYASGLHDKTKLKRKMDILKDLNGEAGDAYEKIYGKPSAPLGDLNNALVADLITYSRYYDDVEGIVVNHSDLYEAINIYKNVPEGLEEGLSFLRRMRSK
ncbi:aminopeptidase [Candidatus Woesearchaeota archaeon]|nr:aminopeptidase [Candidatus Woesearchaeota archaeon]